MVGCEGGIRDVNTNLCPSSVDHLKTVNLCTHNPPPSRALSPPLWPPLLQAELEDAISEHQDLAAQHAELREALEGVRSSREAAEAQTSRLQSELWYMLRERAELEQQVQPPYSPFGGREGGGSAW